MWLWYLKVWFVFRYINWLDKYNCWSQFEIHCNYEFYMVGHTSVRMNGQIRQGTVLKGIHLGAITSLCETYCSTFIQKLVIVCLFLSHRVKVQLINTSSTYIYSWVFVECKSQKLSYQLNEYIWQEIILHTSNISRTLR